MRYFFLQSDKSPSVLKRDEYIDKSLVNSFWQGSLWGNFQGNKCFAITFGKKNFLGTKRGFDKKKFTAAAVWNMHFVVYFKTCFERLR